MQSVPAKTACGFLGLAAILVLVAWTSVDAAVDGMLRRDAERTAWHWGNVLSHRMVGIEDVAAGRPASPRTRGCST